LLLRSHQRHFDDDAGREEERGKREIERDRESDGVMERERGMEKNYRVGKGEREHADREVQWRRDGDIAAATSATRMAI